MATVYLTEIQTTQIVPVHFLQLNLFVQLGQLFEVVERRIVRGGR